MRFIVIVCLSHVGLLSHEVSLVKVVVCCCLLGVVHTYRQEMLSRTVDHGWECCFLTKVRVVDSLRFND